MRTPNAMRFDGQIHDQGTIRGQFISTGCVYSPLASALRSTEPALDEGDLGVSAT
jgi:hypothetical protein